jgi:putative membrane protein
MIEYNDQAHPIQDGRINWAHERTRLAKERTFAAWLRTGLSAVAVGLGLVKLFPSVEPRWMMQAMGILFVGSGGIVFVMGYKTYYTVIKKLESEGFKGIPSALMGGVTAILLLGTIIGLTLVIIE